MKTKAYIIRKNQLIASVMTDLKSGSFVEYSFYVSGGILVNAKSAKISRAKKWEKKEWEAHRLFVKKEIRSGKFLLDELDD